MPLSFTQNIVLIILVCSTEEAPTHKGDDQGLDAGRIAVIVIGSLFGFAIIVGATAFVIIRIVKVRNENTARAQGVVHSKLICFMDFSLCIYFLD